jgi:hypothetical protein
MSRRGFQVSRNAVANLSLQSGSLHLVDNIPNQLRKAVAFPFVRTQGSN